jgi:hypothetical protein
MPLIDRALEGKGLHNVGMLDLLQFDPRPTFVLATTATTSGHNESTLPMYWNPSLAAITDGSLLSMLQDKSLAVISGQHRYAFSKFRSWIFNQEETAKPCSYRGYNWVKVVLASQWTVIFGAPIETSTRVEAVQLEGATLSKRISRSAAPTVDWTDELPPTRTSPHVTWARSLDWSQTPLGPMTTWSSQLRSVANLVMQDPRPAVVFCGPELVMIYNESYIQLLGGFHPCMGVSARVALSGVWSKYFEPIIVQNLAGETVEQTDTSIHMVRNGFLEETYFSLKFIPIVDSEGATVAHYEPLTETVSPVMALFFFLSV